MLLAVDIGNTNTVLGVFDGPELVESWRVKTDARDTADELALIYRGLLGPTKVDGVAACSTVPAALAQLRIMLDRYYAHLPAIVVDFGTSTNFDVVSAKGEFVGGVLAPGIEISIDALASRAARLLKVELTRPRTVIGKSTVEALQSGILYGFAGQIDGLVRRIEAELGARATVIATGGLAQVVIAESETLQRHEPDLTLVGLRLVYERNT